MELCFKIMSNDIIYQFQIDLSVQFSTLLNAIDNDVRKP